MYGGVFFLICAKGENCSDGSGTEMVVASWIGLVLLETIAHRQGELMPALSKHYWTTDIVHFRKQVRATRPQLVPRLTGLGWDP